MGSAMMKAPRKLSVKAQLDGCRQELARARARVQYLSELEEKLMLQQLQEASLEGLKP